MRQTFDSKTPLWEQRIRVALAKKKGWKHGTKRRSWKAKEQQRSGANHLKMLRARFKKKMRAFWTGKTDVHP
jgi:hypothetical protein